ncbi:hypothetical protein PghCCS26_08430 [Paenibacillus glycanilyticus]|uniref:Uncharacterized protein n=1 Tax=Paenibacillus glycanilyticus TaxID=126569 RepID=A0ABQ6NF61_9BACL|nr:hypothetical protein [Paenibacillus glycanilyticus]GMK43716.1 hypothetical protein PghCCS26_08430 [Paenibacillus glycanilyticus]
MNTDIISGIQLYHLCRDNSHYGLLSMSCGSETGWGECVITTDAPHFDIIAWGDFLCKLNRQSLADARNTALLNREVWGDAKTELVLMALSNLDHSAAAAREEETPDSSILFEESMSYFSVL